MSQFRGCVLQCPYLTAAYVAGPHWRLFQFVGSFSWGQRVRPIKSQKLRLHLSVHHSRRNPRIHCTASKPNTPICSLSAILTKNPMSLHCNRQVAHTFMHCTKKPLPGVMQTKSLTSLRCEGRLATCGRKSFTGTLVWIYKLTSQSTPDLEI